MCGCVDRTKLPIIVTHSPLSQHSVNGVADASPWLTCCILLVQALAQAQQVGAQLAAEPPGKHCTSFKHSCRQTLSHPTTPQAFVDAHDAQMHRFPKDAFADQRKNMTVVGNGPRLPRTVGQA